MLLVMVLFFIEKYGHHAISKFKLWLTVMEISVFIRKRMQHNVAIKSHRRSFSVLTPELKKNG
jgi:uncharacterized membrane protein YoaT (DUF817 family)